MKSILNNSLDMSVTTRSHLIIHWYKSKINELKEIKAEDSYEEVR